jgi:hypothetical protein
MTLDEFRHSLTDDRAASQTDACPRRIVVGRLEAGARIRIGTTGQASPCAGSRWTRNGSASSRSCAIERVIEAFEDCEAAQGAFEETAFTVVGEEVSGLCRFCCSSDGSGKR